MVKQPHPNPFRIFYTNMRLFQLKTLRLHLRTGGDVPDCPAAHDPEPGFSSHKLHAPEVIERPLDAGRPGILPGPHEVPSYVPEPQQRTTAQTGKCPWQGGKSSFSCRRVRERKWMLLLVHKLRWRRKCTDYSVYIGICRSVLIIVRFYSRFSCAWTSFL